MPVGGSKGLTDDVVVGLLERIPSLLFTRVFFLFFGDDDKASGSTCLC